MTLVFTISAKRKLRLPYSPYVTSYTQQSASWEAVSPSPTPQTPPLLFYCSPEVHKCVYRTPPLCSALNPNKSNLYLSMQISLRTPFNIIHSNV